LHSDTELLKLFLRVVCNEAEIVTASRTLPLENMNRWIDGRMDRSIDGRKERTGISA
jgi:hypothetical protein